MENLKKVLTNTVTVLALVGLIGRILLEVGVQVDIEWLNNLAKLVCEVLVLLGIMNNKGMATTKWNE